MIIIIVIALIFLCYIFSTTAKFGKVNKTELVEYIKCLLYRAADNSFLIIRKINHRQFIQFKKKIVKKGSVDIICEFPIAYWSKKYINNVTKVLSENGLKYTVMKRKKIIPLEFIIVNFHDDVQACVKVTIGIFDEIYNFNSNAK